VSVYCIPTKLGTKMCPYTAYLCTNFQGTQIAHFHLNATLTPWRKEEKKTKKLCQFLKVYTLETPGAILLQFGIWGTDSGGISTAKIVRFRKSSMKVHICENCIIVVPVNILMGVAPASWATWHTTVCLDRVSWSLLLFLPIYSWVWRTSFLGHATHYRVSWYNDCLSYL